MCESVLKKAYDETTVKSQKQLFLSLSIATLVHKGKIKQAKHMFKKWLSLLGGDGHLFCKRVVPIAKASRTKDRESFLVFMFEAQDFQKNTFKSAWCMNDLRLLFMKSLIKLGAYKKAVQALSEFSKTISKHPALREEVIYLLAKTYFLKGTYIPCRDQLEFFRATNPENEIQAKALFLLSHCQSHLGLLSEALKTLNGLQCCPSLIDAALLSQKKRFLVERIQKKSNNLR